MAAGSFAVLCNSVVAHFTTDLEYEKYYIILAEHSMLSLIFFIVVSTINKQYYYQYFQPGSEKAQPTELLGFRALLGFWIFYLNEQLRRLLIDLSHQLCFYLHLLVL